MGCHTHETDCSCTAAGTNDDVHAFQATRDESQRNVGPTFVSVDGGQTRIVRTSDWCDEISQLHVLISRQSTNPK